MDKEKIKPLEVNTGWISELSKTIASKAVTNARIAWKTTYINENGDTVTFEPIQQEDGTYLLIGKMESRELNLKSCINAEEKE